MGKNSYEVGAWDAELKDYVPETSEETVLPDGLRLKSVWTSLDGLKSEGDARTRFRPQGDATHTYIHLEDDNGQELTIEVRALLGKPEIHTGWSGPTT